MHNAKWRKVKGMDNILVENAKVMAKGQITLPKEIREALGVSTGDRVTLIRQDDQVIMMNSAVYAVKMLQQSMAGEAERAGMKSDDDVVNMIMKMRSEENE
jgi:AbrB family looped-hinge helix DNA binding protein